MAEDFTDLIRQVKDANDIVEVIGGYLALRPAGQAYKGLCPFHDDRNPSLTVDPRWKNFRCWACGKHGDVITFVMEFDRLEFWEALELLARRAGISLEKTPKFQQASDRAVMLETVKWAEQQFHECLLNSEELGAAARKYLGERQLTGETVRKYGLGYAPVSGDWLVQKANAAGMSLEMLEKVGLIARRKEGKGWYDRFRDRVMFPIRDLQGRTVGFGGRVLPDSPFSSRGPKYYNSCDTPLFNKSELLYGLDQARHAAVKAGYLAVVEGYTDALMAHQKGVLPVVATMGTALNARHVRQLQRLVPQAILVFDADAGGSKGVDRALEIVASHDVSLRIAALPEGLDPYDLLVKQGAEAFTLALTNAQDVLEFKLNQVGKEDAFHGVEGRRRAVDEVLRIIARGPEVTRGSDQLKRELMMTRIGQRFGIKEETLWGRLRELRAEQQTDALSDDKKTTDGDVEPTQPRHAPAKPHERELLEVLLSEPALVAEAHKHIVAEQVEHPGLRLLLEGMYRLLAEGAPPTLENLRTRIENYPLLAKAQDLQERGQGNTERRAWLARLIRHFDELRQEARKQELQQQLYTAGDHATALELLRQLQNRTSS